MTKTKIAIIAVCAIVTIAANAQNLLLNGSFESPSLVTNTWNHPATPSAWQVANGSSAMVNGVSSYQGIWPLPEDGQQYVDLGNPGTGDAISQVFTVTNEGYYVLSWFGSAPNYSDGVTNSPYLVTISNAVAQVVTTTNFDDYNDTPAWVSHSIQMLFSPGQYTLTFQCEAIPRFENCELDNVTLTQTNTDLVATIHLSAVDICWSGLTNVLYQVQFTTTLGGTNWFNLGFPVTGTGMNCITDSITDMQQRFYRVVRVP